MSNCLIHTCQTIDDFNKTKFINIYKNIFNNKLKFYRSIPNHIEVSNCINLFFELKNKFTKNILNSKPNNYCWINWNKIIFPEKLKLALFSKSQINDFYPSNFYFNPNPKEKLYILNNIFDNYFQNVVNIQPTKQILLLFEEVAKELVSFMDNNNTNQNINEENINVKNIFKNIFNCGDYFLINSIDNKQYMFLSQFATCFLSSTYILLIPNYPEENVQINSENIYNNYIFLTDKHLYFKKNDLTINLKYLYDISNSENIVYGYIKDKLKKELLNMKVNNKSDIKKIYKYSNKETNMELNSSSFYDHDKNSEYLKFRKNNCDFEEYYDHKNQLTHIISQCMISDNTGMRFRGKFTGTSQDGKPIKKSIYIDDELKYLLEGDEVKVDTLLSKKRKNDEGIIVYKIAKSEQDDLRIVKLFIPPDAKIARPIDEEYFITFGKERCDKAIVMDIQLPIKDEEISVVPKEMTAYSYIHKINGTNSFEYKVGQEVYPDSFNSDENISCANGLHFYQDRLTVFKAFIDNI